MCLWSSWGKSPIQRRVRSGVVAIHRSGNTFLGVGVGRGSSVQTLKYINRLSIICDNFHRFISKTTVGISKQNFSKLYFSSGCRIYIYIYPPLSDSSSRVSRPRVSRYRTRTRPRRAQVKKSPTGSVPARRCSGSPPPPARARVASVSSIYLGSVREEQHEK